jgi:hypothetical protein
MPDDAPLAGSLEWAQDIASHARADAAQMLENADYLNISRLLAHLDAQQRSPLVVDQEVGDILRETAGEIFGQTKDALGLTSDEEVHDRLFNERFMTDVARRRDETAYWLSSVLGPDELTRWERVEEVPEHVPPTVDSSGEHVSALSFMEPDLNYVPDEPAGDQGSTRQRLVDAGSIVLAGFNPGQGGDRIVYGIEKGNQDAVDPQQAIGEALTSGSGQTV